MCKFNPISLRKLITQYNPNKLLIKFKFFLAIYMYMYVQPQSAQITAQYIKNYPENSVSVSHIFVSSYFKWLFLFISISVIHGMTLHIEYENNFVEIQSRSLSFSIRLVYLSRRFSFNKEFSCRQKN